MNKVITINLGGTAWQVEEGGYDTLRIYLETATARLQGNPDRDEIISDIEWAIAEKFRPLISNHKNVVLNQEVAAVLAEMGPIEAEPGKAPTPGPIGPGSSAGTGNAGGAWGSGPRPNDKTAGASPSPKRLYRIREGEMLAGVCNGLAAYINIDPTFVRLAFAFSAIFWGFGIGVYIVMALVVPEAKTAEEKAAASGNPSTAEEFIRRAKAGYYEAIKGFPNRQARRDWQRRFSRGMRFHTTAWRCNWQSYWGRHMQAHPGMVFALPFISVVTGLATIIWVCALVSLLSTGGLFGVSLPPNVPVWVAAAALFLVYGVIVGPLKMMRRACHWGMGQPRPAWPAILLFDAITAAAVVAALAWLACHHFPEVNEAVKNFPAQAHQAANDIQTWWKGK